MGRVTSIACVIGCVMLGCSEDPSSLDTRAQGTSGTGTNGTATSGSSGTSSDASAADLCVTTINQLRATKGLAPYARWTATETCADSEAQSDGATSGAHGAFGKCGEVAQNECPGWPGPPSAMIPECLKAMWAEGPGGGHYEAMSSRLYTKVSCGFATAPGAAGSIWSVQNFR